MNGRREDTDLTKVPQEGIVRVPLDIIKPLSQSSKNCLQFCHAICATALLWQPFGKSGMYISMNLQKSTGKRGLGTTFKRILANSLNLTCEAFSASFCCSKPWVCPLIPPNHCALSIMTGKYSGYFRFHSNNNVKKPLCLDCCCAWTVQFFWCSCCFG